MSSYQTQDRSPNAENKTRCGGFGYLLEDAVRSVIRMLPGGKNSLEPAIKYLRLQFRHWLRVSKAILRIVDENENLLTLDPALVEFCPTTEFEYKFFKGAAYQGDWDQSDKRFDQSDVYSAFYEVCKLKTKSWPETYYYKSILTTVESGQSKYQCNTKADLEKRCKELTALYNSIEKEGYKSQAELNGPLHDEVALAISRDGQFLFGDGAHRLAIAKLLGLKEIPVLVSVRHPEWIAFKAQLQEFMKSQTLGTLYRRASHPDLIPILAEHASAERFAKIEPHLPSRRGNVLDIGSKLGDMCHRFEELGFFCIGVEMDETHLYFMRKLRDYSNRKFEIRAGSFLTDMELTKRKFEVVLALNILHHFLKTEKDYQLLIQFLARLKVNHMIIETHLPEEVQTISAYKHYSPEEFCALVMELTGLTKKKHIFRAHNGRDIFLLNRQ